ncbi:hypothetical protein HW555_007751 [Spodoptera exigua]|uniref:Uncharacterized protein n=1 Tax=Spodoptera exigua TaxID=7107 RepID=A0A835L8J7_SPOEX|nr:hypothetical protein HW555_007751 [Spodoptera exigua]
MLCECVKAETCDDEKVQIEKQITFLSFAAQGQKFRPVRLASRMVQAFFYDSFGLSTHGIRKLFPRAISSNSGRPGLLMFLDEILGI